MNLCVENIRNLLKVIKGNRLVYTQCYTCNSISYCMLIFITLAAKNRLIFLIPFFPAVYWIERIGKMQICVFYVVWLLVRFFLQAIELRKSSKKPARDTMLIRLFLLYNIVLGTRINEPKNRITGYRVECSQCMRTSECLKNIPIFIILIMGCINMIQRLWRSLNQQSMMGYFYQRNKEGRSSCGNNSLILRQAAGVKKPTKVNMHSEDAWYKIFVGNCVFLSLI